MDARGRLLSTQEARVALGYRLVRLLRHWQTRTHCCGHIVADTNFPRLPARATFFGDTTFVSGTQKVFLILFRNILFPSLRSMETQHSFCVPRVCAPKKHHEQQCVLVCQYLYASFVLSNLPRASITQSCTLWR